MPMADDSVKCPELARKHKAEQSRLKREWRRANGLCSLCDEPAFFKTFCQRHRIYMNNFARRQRADRRARGVCWRCQAPVVKYGLCIQHYMKALEYEGRTNRKDRIKPDTP